MGDGPKAWKRLSQGEARDYRILTVRQDQVVNPRNQLTEDYVSGRFG